MISKFSTAEHASAPIEAFRPPILPAAIPGMSLSQLYSEVGSSISNSADSVVSDADSTSSSDTLSILQPFGYSASTCGYCAEVKGQRSRAKGSKSYGSVPAQRALSLLLSPRARTSRSRLTHVILEQVLGPRVELLYVQAAARSGMEEEWMLHVQTRQPLDLLSSTHDLVRCSRFSFRFSLAVSEV